jgi:hypothetical protein
MSTNVNPLNGTVQFTVFESFKAVFMIFFINLPDTEMKVFQRISNFFFFILRKIFGNKIVSNLKVNEGIWALHRSEDFHLCRHVHLYLTRVVFLVK